MRSLQAIIVICLTVLVLSACGRTSAPSAETVAEPAIEQTIEPTVEPAIATAEPTPTIQAPQPSASVDLPPLADDVSGRLSSYLESLILQPGDPPQRSAPGGVLLVDLPDGRFLGAAGSADLATNRMVDPADAFEIGSITKLFTAAILLQLHEEDVLSLDDSLSMWLPELAASIPNGEAMTLRQLASHTAGLNEYERDLYPLPQLITDQTLRERGFAPEEIVQWVAANKPSLFAPGTPGGWQYSNTGYILLGMVLEAATGESLDDLYVQRIFEPLGLESGMLLEGVPQDGQIVRGYNAMNGDYADMTRWNASGAWAAGALAMNAADLAEFAHALIDGLLFQNNETLDLMTNFVSTGQDRGFIGYGLGLAQLQDGAWGHAGGTPGFGSSLVIDPERETVVIFLGNSGSFNVNPMELSALPNVVGR